MDNALERKAQNGASSVLGKQVYPPLLISPLLGLLISESPPLSTLISRVQLIDGVVADPRNVLERVMKGRSFHTAETGECIGCKDIPQISSS